MNDGLINSVASRVDTPPAVVDITSPVDELAADSLTARQLIRGWIATAREEVARWQPSEYPGRGA